ncbi:TetR/AcrR family transcriptional regulator C-terminal domain-containing protein [Nocardia huaxiensis]|uniref:TetR/AcrR family transcriptional regulator C-terminal domain-containing protein n=1 Tax=Nocardia huaxiensis TaxID=2755382 RepID=A0A7D6ZNG7_9NOCA|nr:TetR/AcrR family transcriptional regulator C-terminal domain-containing protein [Nocardia huaxiensis]
MWTRPRQRRERPALTLGRIVTEAILLMDAEGIEALSMRALGLRLQAGATSVYRHVASREELIELAVDEVYREIEVPYCLDPEGWRDAVAASAQSMRAMILRHRWVSAALPSVGLLYLGPNVLRFKESLIQAFDIAGYPRAETDSALAAVIGYVVGMGVGEAAWLGKVAQSGRGEREWTAELWPHLDRLAHEHPRLAESIAARAEVAPEAIRDAKFEYGLERILDGLQLRLTAN